jgi:ABC-2 type transport system ATP-binding protein
MDIIQTKNLSKAFGTVSVVDNISLNVRQGEIYGFLGLNGAGKTTTIRLLLGMIKPTQGNVLLFEKKITDLNIWNNVGYLVETPYSYPNLTVRENLEVYFQLRKLKDKKLIDNIIEKLYLTKYQNKKAEHLSLGNAQRLGLAKALIHQPKLLILDEPINGLDPAGIVEIRELLKDLAYNHNTTIFLSSHILNEISKLANRFGIIHDGKLIKEINSEELENLLTKKLLINTLNNLKAQELLNNIGFETTINNENLLETSLIKAIEKPEDIAKILVNNDLPPKMLYTFEENLEAFFLRLTGNN